jgi:hypothetical protein
MGESTANREESGSAPQRRRQFRVRCGEKREVRAKFEDFELPLGDLSLSGFGLYISAAEFAQSFRLHSRVYVVLRTGEVRTRLPVELVNFQQKQGDRDLVRVGFRFMAMSDLLKCWIQAAVLAEWRDQVSGGKALSSPLPRFQK